MWVCLSVCPCMYLPNYFHSDLVGVAGINLTIYLDFFTSNIVAVARFSSKMIRIWTQEFIIKIFFRMRDRTKYDINVCHDIKHALCWGKCTMMSKVNRSERGSGISDYLVLLLGNCFSFDV